MLKIVLAGRGVEPRYLRVAYVAMNRYWLGMKIRRCQHCRTTGLCQQATFQPRMRDCFDTYLYWLECPGCGRGQRRMLEYYKPAEPPQCAYCGGSGYKILSNPRRIGFIGARCCPKPGVLLL